MTRPAIAYLEAYQRLFSSVLRAPLDASRGTLHAQTEAYPEALALRVRAAGLEPRQRLAVYHRQYWFRLFNVLQGEHRLTTALMGAWTFNRLAASFLVAHAPLGHELADVTDGFAAHAAAAIPEAGLAVEATTVPRAAIIEALAIDTAFGAAMRAPREVPLRLTAEAAPTLAAARLVWSRSFTLVEETWPLVALRHELPAPLGEHRATLPAPHAGGSRCWTVVRSPRGLRVMPAEPLLAQLLRLLREHPLGVALATLEARSSERAVAGRARRWFAEGIEHGFWTGLEVVP